MIIVDTSLALQWVLAEPDTDRGKLATRDEPFAKRVVEGGYGAMLAELAT